MKRVTLHIDRLVLRGFRREDRHGVADGLQQELARMLSDPETARELVRHGDASRLRLGSMTIHQGTTPQQLGTQVARSLDRRMKK